MHIVVTIHCHLQSVTSIVDKHSCSQRMHVSADSLSSAAVVESVVSMSDKDNDHCP